MSTQEKSPTTRVNIYLGEDLADRVNQAAAEAGASRGKPVSVSEWLRDLITKELGTRPAEEA